MILICPICGLVVGNAEQHARWHFDRHETAWPISILEVRDYEPCPDEYPGTCDLFFCGERAYWQYNEVRACHKHLFELG